MTMTFLRLVPIEYHCPPWCERSDHHADVVSATEPAVHFGPGFPDGPILVAVQGCADTSPEVVVYAEGDLTLSQENALRLAAQLSEAAAWIEANQ